MLIELEHIQGFRVGENVIRGCFTKIFSKSSDQLPSFLENFSNQQHDRNGVVCHPMSPSSFMPPKKTSIVSDKHWQICLCYGRLCNDKAVLRESNAAIVSPTVISLFLTFVIAASQRY